MANKAADTYGEPWRVHRRSPPTFSLKNMKRSSIVLFLLWSMVAVGLACGRITSHKIGTPLVWKLLAGESDKRYSSREAVEVCLEVVGSGDREYITLCRTNRLPTHTNSLYFEGPIQTALGSAVVSNGVLEVTTNETIRFWSSNPLTVYTNEDHFIFETMDKAEQSPSGDRDNAPPEE